VSCRLVEYSLRRGRLRKCFHEKSEGSLSDSALGGAAVRKRSLAVRRYVMIRTASMAMAMMAICPAC
jgi:hypothetical protein